VISTRRAGRVVRVVARASELCRVHYKLLTGRRVVARASAVARPGRARTTELRLRTRARRAFKLVVETTDAVGNRGPARALRVR
jgi:hypothetical protein